MKLGNAYREQYPSMCFADKKACMDEVLKQYFQLVHPPRFLFSSIYQTKRRDLRVVELGGYDGTQALDILQSYPQMSWVNYDISRVAAENTRPELAEYNYRIVVLEKPFIEYTLEPFDLFYSSKTLEHLTLTEAMETLTHTQQAKHQVHIVDWFWRKDDTHVIEPDSHNQLTRHLERLHYHRKCVSKQTYQSRIFYSKGIK